MTSWMISAVNSGISQIIYSIFNIISKFPASLLLWGIDLFCEFTFP